MHAQQLSAAVGAAQTPQQLDEISRLLWQAVAEERIEDDEAQRIAQAIEARRPRRSPGLRLEVVDGGKPAPRVSIFPPKRRPRTRERQEAIEHRRALAAPSWMPRHLAKHFTPAELAVLKIVADEVDKRGNCDRSIDELADRAKASRSTVKRALRVAEAENLVLVHRRPQQGAKSLTNLVAIVSKEWLAWLARGKRIGVQRRTALEPGRFKEASERSQVGPSAVQAAGRSAIRAPGAVVRLDERREKR